MLYIINNWSPSTPSMHELKLKALKLKALKELRQKTFERF